MRHFLFSIFDAFYYTTNVATHTKKNRLIIFPFIFSLSPPFLSFYFYVPFSLTTNVSLRE